MININYKIKFLKINLQIRQMKLKKRQTFQKKMKEKKKNNNYIKFEQTK